MAEIHNASMSPSKLELLSSWMPTQDCFIGPAQPQLSKAGGFRLDDPAGLVGIEFMIVRALHAGVTVHYSVPMTYRGEPLRGGEPALIGGSVHGLLGHRWIYDGVEDPVFVEELARLLSGLALPQHQVRSAEVDAAVLVRTTIRHDEAERARVIRVLTQDGLDCSPSVRTTWLGPEGNILSGPVVA